MSKKTILILISLLIVVISYPIYYLIFNRVSADIEKKENLTTEEVLSDEAIGVELVKYTKKSLPESNEIIVKYKNIPNEKKEKIAASLNLKDDPKKEVKEINIKVYAVPKGLAKKDIYEKLKKTGMVEYAEPNSIISVDYIPNDPQYPNQWHHPKIGSPTAWDSSQGEGVTIAILDTGTNCTHPDLASACVPGYDFYYNDSDPDDVNGHGTTTAGTAAAIGDNANQVAGVSYRSKIMPLKVFSDDGHGSYSALVNSIIYAADHGVKVINASAAPITTSKSIIDAASYARSKGSVVVVSAGNAGVEECILPSDELIVVSATDENDLLKIWSSYGIGVDIAAPGVRILTTAKGGGTVAQSGTSYSAPITSGVLGLMSAYDQSLTPIELTNYLFSAAKDLGETGYDKYYGWGRVDVASAITLIKSAKGDTEAPTAPTNLNATVASDKINLTWEASVDNVEVAGYKIYRNDTEIGSSLTTNYADNSALAGNSHKYYVKAYDVQSNLSASSNEVIIDLPDNNPPTAPTNLSATIASDKINLTWEASVDNVEVAGYKIYRDSVEIDSSSFNSYSDTTAQHGQSYSYYIKAVDKSGNFSDPSNIIVVNYSDSQPPTNPNDLQAVLDSSNNVQLTWTASSDNIGVVGYKVYRNDFEIDDVTINSAVDNTVEYDTAYTYYVKAYDAASNTSSPSNAVSITIPRPGTLKISNYQVTNLTDISATISWTTTINTTGVVNYGIARSSINLASSRYDMTSSTTHSLILNNLKKGNRYSFQITATNPDNKLETVQSPIDFFTTTAPGVRKK